MRILPGRSQHRRSLWISLYLRWTASGSFGLGIYWSRFWIFNTHRSVFSVQFRSIHFINWYICTCGTSSSGPDSLSNLEHGFPNLASGHPTSVCTTHSVARHPCWAGHPALADWTGGVPSHLRSGRLVSAGPLLPVPGLTVRGAGWLRYGWFRWSLITAGFRSG